MLKESKETETLHFFQIFSKNGNATFSGVIKVLQKCNDTTKNRRSYRISFTMIFLLSPKHQDRGKIVCMYVNTSYPIIERRRRSTDDHHLRAISVFFFSASVSVIIAKIFSADRCSFPFNFIVREC